MKKESVNKFDLEAAFKALEEIEVPAVKGIKPNRENLQEKFTKKSTTEVLVEDYFDVNDQGDLEAAQEEREAEIAKAKLARIEKIVDLDAESEEDLLPSYVGKFIIQCPQCMTLFYKNQEDIEKSEENPEVVNINEVCQHCGNTSGYTLIGKVDNVGEEEAENYDVEDFDENELNLDFDAEEESVEEESTEEEPVEDETAEEGNEEELELEPVEETEEETSEEEEVKESLNESIEDLKASSTIVDYVEYKHSYCHALEPKLKKINYYANVLKKPVNYIRAMVKGIIKDSPEVRWTDKEQWFMSKLNEFWPDSYELYKFIKNSIEKARDTWVYVDADGELVPELNKDMISLLVKESLNESKVVEIETDQLCSVVLDNRQMFVGSEKECEDYINEHSSIPAVAARGGFKLLKTAKVHIDREIEESLNEARTNDWVVIQHYYPTLCRKDQAREVAEALDQAVELFLNETLGGIDEIEKEAKRISGIKDFSMLLMANYEALNIPYGQPLTAEQYAKCVLESELSRTLYVVGVNVYGKPFRDELKKAGYDSAKALRLTEAVDKELDDKLKAHNEYIEYLKDMIEKEEKSLASAKNDFVKKSIQSRIDALKADLEAALPEALKGEVETELPTAEEVELEATENTEEKEETNESLKESLTLTEDEEGVKSSGDPKTTYKIKYSYKYTDEQAKGDEPKVEVKTVSASSYEEAEDEIWSLVINAKRPHEFTVLEVNDEKYDSFIKKLKKGASAKDNAKNVKEEVEESLAEDTEVKPRVRHQSRREIFSRELATHPAFEGISTRDLERYIIDLYLEDDPTAELDVEQVVDYIEDLGWGKIILDNIDNLSEGQVRHFAQKDPVFISTIKEFLGDWLLSNKIYSVGALVSELLIFLGKKPADREEAKEFNFDPNDASYKEFKDELADIYYEAKRLVPVGEALVGDVNINLDARGQSVGIAGGTGGEVHNDMTEGFEDNCKKAEQKGLVEVKAELNPAEANKCEMIIQDDSGKKHYFTTPERAADLEKAYSRSESSEQLDEFIGPAVASIAGAAGAASVAKSAASVVNSLVSEEVEEPLKEAGDLDTLLDSEEFKKPISDEEVDRIIAKYESLEEDVEPGIESELAIQDIVDTWESVEEIDEESLDKLTENYLTEVYSNVKSFKTTDCSLAENKLVVEGKITFNSGKSKSTKFIYEATKTADNKVVLEGLNADFATEKAFILNCNLDTANCLVVESLNYKYTINNTLVEGLTK